MSFTVNLDIRNPRDRQSFLEHVGDKVLTACISTLGTGFNVHAEHAVTAVGEWRCVRLSLDHFELIDRCIEEVIKDIVLTKIRNFYRVPIWPAEVDYILRVERDGFCFRVWIDLQKEIPMLTIDYVGWE